MDRILIVHSSNTPDGKFAACVASLTAEGYNRQNSVAQHVNLKFFPSTYRRGNNAAVNGFDRIQKGAFDTALVIGYPITSEELLALAEKVSNVTYVDYRQPSDDVAAILKKIGAFVAIDFYRCASELMLKWLLPTYSETVQRGYLMSVIQKENSLEETEARFDSVLNVLRTHTLYGGDENSDIMMMMFSSAVGTGSRGLWAELLIMPADVWAYKAREARIKYTAIQEVMNGAIYAGPTYFRKFQGSLYEIKVVYAHQPHMSMTLRRLAKQKETAFSLVYTTTASGGVKCMITAADEFKHLVKSFCKELGGGANDSGVGGFDFSDQGQFFAWLTWAT